ncbi:hypothetical protein Tco_1400571 [Tanacetum coccineum]
MSVNRRLFTLYKEYEGGHGVIWSNLKGKVIDIGQGFCEDCAFDRDFTRANSTAFNEGKILFIRSDSSDRTGAFEEKRKCNDKNLSEIQLEHEKKDEFVVVVVKDCMMVVKEIVSRLLEEVEVSPFGKEKMEWWFEKDIDDEGE